MIPVAGAEMRSSTTGFASGRSLTIACGSPSGFLSSAGRFEAAATNPGTRNTLTCSGTRPDQVVGRTNNPWSMSHADRGVRDEMFRPSQGRYLRNPA